MRLLLAKRVDPDSKVADGINAGRTPLSFAAEHGHAAVVKLLLAEDVDPAAENGHETVAKLLLAKDVVLDSKVTG